MLRRQTAVLASSATVLALAVAVMPANAAEPDPNTSYAYAGSAGGTYVRVLGETVSSDPTAASGINGTTYPNQNSNAVATAKVGTLVQAGAISTETTVDKVGTTITQTSKAKTLGVSLLNGYIKADALTTVTEAKRTGTELSGDSDTELVGITIRGKKVPVNVSNNFGVDIPGVATVLLNEKKVDIVGGKITVTGSALKVTLLKKYEGSPVGTTVTINPTTASLTPNGPTATSVGGYAYGTYGTAKVGNEIKTVVGTTAAIATPIGSTFGYDIYNRSVAVKLPLVLQLGVVQSMANSVSGATTADVTHSNEITGVNVLNGLVKADAIKVTARSQKFSLTERSNTSSAELVNLVIGGKRIAASAAPNTTLTVPGIAKVVVNEQTGNAYGRQVVGVRIILLSPRSGLSTGADITIAVAASITY